MLLADIDWANAVFIPLLLSVTVGVLLALYAGLVATRMFAFIQARQRASEWLMEVGKILGEKIEGPHELSIRVGESIRPIMSDLRALGHYAAAELLGDIFVQFLGDTARYLNIAIPPAQIPEFPLTLPSQQTVRFIAYMRQRWSARFDRDFVAISRSKPDLMPIVTFRLFPVYGVEGERYLGLLKKRTNRWTKIKHYLNGEAEDWN